MVSVRATVGFILLSLRLVHGQVIESPVCDSDDTELYSDLVLKHTFESMMQTYNRTCTPAQCNLQPSDPVEGFLTWKHNGNNFAMRSSCPSRRGFRACEVTSTVYHHVNAGGIEVRGYVIEENKGVCFPSTCSDDQVNLLDPNPGRCDPLTMDCTIVGYDVNCPNRQVSNTERCADDALASTSPYFIAQGATELAILADCASLFSGTGSIGLCSARTGPVDAQTKTDFTGFETDPTYTAHESTCLNLGGKLCQFDLDGHFTVSGPMMKDAISEIVPITSAADVTVRNQFIGFPRCIAASCGEEVLPDVLAKHANTFLQQYGLECDIDSDACSVEISNIQCKDSSTVANMVTQNPTTSPTTSPTKIPTISPTKMPTTSPTQNPTNAPTSLFFPTVLSTNPITEFPVMFPTEGPATVSTSKSFSQPPSKFSSVSPSSHPTGTPSFSPSDTRSDAPSVLKSETPSLTPTDTPSESPSIFPSKTPSLTPSDKPSESPSILQSEIPSLLPSDKPSESPSILQSEIPSLLPTDSPSEAPSVEESGAPSFSSANPSSVPSFSSSSPSSLPTNEVSQNVAGPDMGISFSSGASSLSLGTLVPILLFWVFGWELL